MLAVLSVLIGGLAIGTMLFLFIDYHRHGLPAIPHTMTDFLLMVPYVWIVVFVLFIAVAQLGIAHTRKGYRYRLRTIISASVLLSIALGFVLNFIGIGKMTHEFLTEVPFYSAVTYDSRKALDRPSVGRLAGVILSVQDKNNFSLIDFNGHIWSVILATSTNGSFVPEASSTIRMFGLVEASSSVFVAGSIHEWEQ